jgi:asparagine synthase (glutamine-hydrolysing)
MHMAEIVGFTVTGDNGSHSKKLIAMREIIADETNVPASELYCDEHLVCSSSSRGECSSQSRSYVTEDIAVWLDGEIYEYGTPLQESDTNFSTPVTVANLYRRDHDFNFLTSLDGIFCAVIYDRIRRELHLINDRYGMRRLYIWKHDTTLVWATKLRAFLEAPNFRPRINKVALGDFIDLGYVTEDRTLFEEVELLPSGSIFTWDLRANCAMQRRYWWWDAIKSFECRFNEDEIADELGNLFIRAVEKRCRPGVRIGLGLSGGLDSRAILAAIPEQDKNIVAVTFGIPGCPDHILAARAAAVRGAAHYQFVLNKQNWLPPRLRGVWLSDGQYDLMHMHGIEAVPMIRGLYDINISGFLGDAVLGGSYLRREALDHPITTGQAAAQVMRRDPNKFEIGNQYLSLHKTDYYFLQNRARRFVYAALDLAESGGVPSRMPFYDNKLLEFAYSLPDALRYGSRIYRKMLLLKFPAYFKSIPWQKTGVPIGYPDSLAKLFNFEKRVRRKLSTLSGGFIANPLSSYENYADWVRSEPNCYFFDQLFSNPKAIYPAYLPRKVVQSDWNNHLAGQDNSSKVCRYATFEIWLQQIFEKKFRTNADPLDFSNPPNFGATILTNTRPRKS